MRLWYLILHRRPAKAQVTEHSLFAHMKYGIRRRVHPKIRHLAPLDGCACAFENEFTEDDNFYGSHNKSLSKYR